MREYRVDAVGSPGSIRGRDDLVTTTVHVSPAIREVYVENGKGPHARVENL
jgi:hypothetical protein